MEQVSFLFRGVTMKTRNILKSVIFAFFLLMIFSGVALADQSSSLIGELSQVDVFHPPTDPGQMPLYNEWHYFNIIDEEQNLSVLCTFKVNGPINASEILLGYRTNDGNSNTYYRAYPIGMAKYSSQTPDVTIGDSTVRLTPEGYSVHVVSDDGSKVLDALFKPEVEPSPEFNASGFSPLYGGIINWIVTSPKMKVNGELTVDGKTYTLKNTRGYHDHNWGYWNWGDNIGWGWGQTSETKNSLNGNDIGKYSVNFGNTTDAGYTKSFRSVLNLWKNRKIVATFNDNEMQVEHSNFAYVNEPIRLPFPGASLPEGAFPLPLNTAIFASSDSGDYLNMKFVTEKDHCTPLPVAVPMIDANGNPVTDVNGNILIQYRIIWEMIGTYKVDGEIDGKNVSYSADGFMEYVSGSPVLPVLQQ